MAFPDWKDRIPQEEAKLIRDNAEFVGDGCHEKDCFWRGYRLEGKSYIGLNDSTDIWRVDEATMLSHCTE
jgi:hypothetical protein